MRGKLDHSRSHNVERGVEEVDAVSDVMERERSRHRLRSQRQCENASEEKDS
jgi:hypothetical protein